MNPEFLKALRNSATRPPNATPLPPANPQNQQLVHAEAITTPIVAVDILENREKIEIRFSQKPGKAVRERMKAMKFWYRPDDFVWEVRDTDESRGFIAKEFSVELKTKSEERAEALAPAMPLNLVVVPEVEPAKPSNLPDLTLQTYDTYKQQCSELIKALGVDPGDLPLLAIGYFHKLVFSRDS